MSAFANTLGGALIFGMADDGQIVGLTEPDSPSNSTIYRETARRPARFYALRSQRCGAVTAPAGAFRSATAAQRRLLARR